MENYDEDSSEEEVEVPRRRWREEPDEDRRRWETGMRTEILKF